MATAKEKEPMTEQGQHQVTMKRQLGLIDGVVIIVGSVVGSGVFISPKGVLQSAGSVGVALAVWALCGVISFVGAICYAELGTMITRSGGDYTYLREAFGPLPAFLFLWAALLIMLPVNNAISALAFANYILQPFFGTCHPSDLSVKLVALFAVGVLTLLNCSSTRWFAKLQKVFVIGKSLALALIIVTGLAVYLTKGARGLQDPFENTSSDPSRIALSFYSGLFSYTGWRSLNAVAGEVKEPHKTLPRALFLSMSTITVLYVLTNIAYLVVLSPQEILDSSAVAVTFADHVHWSFTYIMQILVAIAALGSLHNVIFGASRMLYASARNGHMPAACAVINVETLSPVPAVLSVGFVTMVIVLVGDVYVLINYTSFVEAICVAATVAGMLWMRRTMPDAPRPIKVNLIFPITFFLVSIFLVCFPIVSSPLEALIAISIMATAVPVFYICISKKRRPRWLSSASESMLRFCQKLFIAVPETDSGSRKKLNSL